MFTCNYKEKCSNVNFVWYENYRKNASAILTITDFYFILAFNFQASIVGRELATNVYRYTHLEPILYALGVGMSTKDPDHLKFLFEGSEEFCCLPSFGVIPAQTSMFDGVPSLPGLNIDLAKVCKS